MKMQKNQSSRGKFKVNKPQIVPMKFSSQNPLNLISPKLQLLKILQDKDYVFSHKAPLMPKSIEWIFQSLAIDNSKVG